MSQFDNTLGKATQLNEQHGDAIEGPSDQIIEKLGDRIDAATGGKFAAQVDQAQAAADQRIGDNHQ